MEKYLDALHARDSREQALKEITTAYAKLAAQVVSLQSSGSQVLTSSTATDSAQEEVRLLKDKVEEMRRDAIVQHEHSRKDKQKIAELVTAGQTFKRNQEELIQNVNEKNRSIQVLQDELFTVQLQLNLLEDKNKALVEENKELVGRWIAKMHSIAETVNDANLLNESLNR